mgnify:CR=1 FL=1
MEDRSRINSHPSIARSQSLPNLSTVKYDSDAKRGEETPIKPEALKVKPYKKKGSAKRRLRLVNMKAEKFSQPKKPSSTKVEDPSSPYKDALGKMAQGFQAH